MTVEIKQATADGMVVTGELVLKSIILGNTGTDPVLQVFDSISAETNKKLDLKVDASIQGYLTEIPCWDLRFATGLYCDVDNGSAFFIYELVSRMADEVYATRERARRRLLTRKAADVVHMTADGQAITGKPGNLRGMIIQGAGSDTQVRLWDTPSAADHLSTNPRLIDAQIDATYEGFLKPIPLYDLRFTNGIYVDVDNGGVFLIYTQDA